MSVAKDIFDLFRTTFSEWNEDKAPRLAAALAYYTAFAIAPLLIIVIAVAGLAFGQEAARGQIVDQIGGQIGTDNAEIIETMIDNANQQDTGIIATVIGVVTIALGAAGFFGQLQDALNTIWEVAPKPGSGIVDMIKTRFLSFTMILGIGFLLLVSLLVSAMLAGIANFVTGILPGTEFLVQIINFLVSFLVVTLLFAMIYKVLPDVIISWSDVWVGAAITALLFNIGKLLLGLYLGNSSIASSYGAAGSLVVLLVWVYYTAQILLFGAEFTQVYARRYGSQIVPADNAVSVSDDPTAQQIASKAVNRAAKSLERTSDNMEQEPIPFTAVDQVSTNRDLTVQKGNKSIWMVAFILYNAVIGTILLIWSLKDRRDL